MKRQKLETGASKSNLTLSARLQTMNDETAATVRNCNEINQPLDMVQQDSRI
jgi:hypothetical protein